MQLFSEYLNKNIDFPEDHSISPHEVLEKTICRETDAQYDAEPFICDAEKVSVKVIIRDGAGAKAVGFGEAGKKNLHNTVAQMYPIKMAIKRAFDDAAVHFLKLPAQDFKLLVDWEERETNQAVQQQAQAAAAATNGRATQAQGSGQAGQSAVQTAQPSGYEKTIVTIGRQRSKNYSVAELAQKDVESLFYIAYTYPQQIHVTAPERLAQIEACRKFIQEHNIQLPNGQVA